MSGEAVVVLGLDIGFAYLGWGLVEVTGAGDMTPVSLGTIITETRKGEKAIAAYRRRTRELHEALSAIEYKGESIWLPGGPVSAIFAEALSFPQNKSSVAKICMAWGGVVFLASGAGLPIFDLSPQDIKKSVTGAMTASKVEVEMALTHDFGMAGIEALLKAGKITSKQKRNHPVDAIAAVVAHRQHEMMLLLRRMLP